MNQFMPDTLFNGLLLCISIQIIFVGVWMLLSKKTLALGLICFIIGTHWIYSLYFPIFESSPWANILLAGYKSLMVFPLLYIFILNREGNHNNSIYIENLLFPVTISLIYLILKLVFSSFFMANITYIINVIFSISFIIFLLYFILILKSRKILENRLKEKVLRRYLFIFWFFSIKEIISYLSFFLTNFFELNSFEFYTSSNRFFWQPFDFLSNSVLLVFAFTEIDGIRKVIFGNNIQNSYNLLKNEDILIEYVSNHLIFKKLFLLEKFDLKKSLIEHSLSEKDFRLYIKKEFKMTANDFLNKLKVDEFLIISDNTLLRSQYDIEALASMAGFNSKATFYRVFKKHYNITPSEYLNNKKLSSN